MPATKGKGKGKGKGKSGKPRGRRTWAKGSKLDLLLSFEEEHRTTADPGGLYKKITAQFLDRYGYDLPFNDEPAEGFLPVIPNLADLPYEEQITEQARRDDISVRLRVKIANWMRHRFNRKQTDEDMVADLLSTISMLTAERPRKRTAMNIYWAENYAARIKKEFTKYWQTAKLTMPNDARMSMCADYVKSRFEDETEEFRLELQQRADTEYKEKMDEYNKHDTLNGTPEAYAHAWAEADNFLHIFVDAIAKKFGMTVSLLLAGPLGSEGGRVVMRSAHSNNVGGMTSLMWPEYDNAGFEKVQESIVRYAESVFSPEECKRRIPTEVDENDNETAHSQSPSDGPSAADEPDNPPTTSRPDVATSSVNLIEATTLARSFPATCEPTYSINNDFGNVGPQFEGEFSRLLRHDADSWNWDATANQQPQFWTNTGFNPYQTPMSMYPMGAAPTAPATFMNTPGAGTFPSKPYVPAAGFVNTPGSPPCFFMNTPGAVTAPATPTAPAALVNTPSIDTATPMVPPASVSAATPTLAPSTNTATPMAPPASVSAATPTLAASVNTPGTVTTPATSTAPAAAMSAATSGAVTAPVASTAPAALVNTPSTDSPPSSLAEPESSPDALSLNGKENKLPPRKKRAREEPADPPTRPQRAPKLPPHLADAGYVQPSKGTRKAKATKKK